MGEKLTGNRLENAQQPSEGTSTSQSTYSDLPGDSLQKIGGPKSKGLTSLWRSLKRWSKVAVAAITTASTAAFVLWLAILVITATFRRHELNIEAITVPATWASNGFTSDVATRRLRDAIRDVQDSAQTSMQKQDVELKSGELGQASTEITIPKAGVTIENVAASLRRLLPGDWQHEVSGEFTSSASTLSIRVRVNGRVAYAAASSEPDAAASLTQNAAFAIVQQTQPFIAAISLYDKGDLPGANAAAMKIVETLPATDENVDRAYNLLGLIAKYRGDEQLEEAYLSKAPNSFVARNNLGMLREYQNRTDEAIAEFNEALRLNPQDPLAHYSLGGIWMKKRREDLAISEYHEAVKLSPNWAYPHVAMGIIFSKRHQPRAAIEEYREAMRLDPTLNIAPFDVGRASLELANDPTLSQMQKAEALIDACDGFGRAGELRHPDAAYYQQQVGLLNVPGVTCPRSSGQILTAKK